MTDTLSLRLSGNLETETRIFSLRGAHLLGMFALTPIAAEFRKWVLDILDRATAYEHFVTEPTAALERALQSGRWFMWADDGRLTLKPVRSDAYVITEEQLASVIREPGGVSLRLLPEIIAAAAERLVNCTSIGGQS